MKSLNVKIPLTIATSMDDKAQLNPNWLAHFILYCLNRELPNEPIQEFTFNYTFKIDDRLHKAIKLKAIEHDLAMNEFIGRLLVKYYQ